MAKRWLLMVEAKDMLEFTNLGGVRVLIHKSDAPTRLNRLGMTHERDNATDAPVRPAKRGKAKPKPLSDERKAQ